jgi:hypothetical protein
MKVLWIAFCMGVFPTLAIAGGSESTSFRTPAKRYGAAYSVKVTLVRNGENYVVPMWIRPDQKLSSIDPGQLALSGWNPKDAKADDVVLSLEHLGSWKFRTSRSDWAVKPEYPKNCCDGVIGQDILKFYKLRFDPRAPVHIEWTHVGSDSAETAGERAEFEKRIGSLFSVKSEVVRVGGDQYDLSITPYELDFPGRRVTFDQEPFHSRSGMKEPLFHFEFTPIERNLDVKGIHARSLGVARNLGLVEGAQVQELDGKSVSSMTRYEIEELLRGKKGKSIEIGFLRDARKLEKSKVIFDFEKNEFTDPRSIQGHPRRN